MYKKYLKYFCLICLFLLASFTYLKDEQKHDNKQENLQTVIFKTSDNTLVPVTVNLLNKDETENNYRAIIETMKSNDYIPLGLYPIFNDKLELNTLIIEPTQLTFDFNKHFKVKNNKEALDICEALSYLFCKDKINNINIKIDGKKVSNLANSSIPLTCINKTLGINNFETSSINLYQTSPVTIYNTKIISGKTYYIPTTTRIENTKQDINQKVSLLLDNFDNSNSIIINKVNLNNGLLSVYLSCNTIDYITQQRLKKSFLSIKEVTNIKMYINNELIDEKVSTNIDNIIQI